MMRNTPSQNLTFQFCPNNGRTLEKKQFRMTKGKKKRKRNTQKRIQQESEVSELKERDGIEYKRIEDG